MQDSEVFVNEGRGGALERILAVLEDDFDISTIESLPISAVKNRLEQLGLATSMPSDLRKLIAERCKENGTNK